MHSRTTLTLTEYQYLICAKEDSGDTPAQSAISGDRKCLPARSFQRLESFLLEKRGDSANPLELMELSARKDVGKIITAKNYVGVIDMGTGPILEILPKIYAADSAEVGHRNARDLVARMLRTLDHPPGKTMQTAPLDTARMPLYECFIRLFLDEVSEIVRRGLRCAYVQTASNENAVRGKILFSEHLRQNSVHKERTFCLFDTYHLNRPENRVLKTALCLLRRRTTSAKNSADISTLLHVFDAIPLSQDPIGELSRCVQSRETRDYTAALRWCQVFFRGESFSPFAGRDQMQALLFPMEQLYESYVAAAFRAVLPPGYRLSAQDQTHCLFAEPSPQFPLRPDLALTRPDGAVFILDTKWKRLESGRQNWGIQNSDMYQMYAYGRQYGASQVLLLYPQSASIPANEERVFRSPDGVSVRTHFLDLSDLGHSLKKLIGILEQFSPVG